MHMKKRASLTALVGVLALTGAACGSDDRPVALPTGVPQAVRDTVTAIPSLTGVGT